MIHEAKNILVEDHGFAELQQFEDGYGTIGYGLRRNDRDYVLVAKKYAHDDLASFIALLVEKFSEACDFIFYNHDSQQFTVFDGRYLAAEAADSSGPSKKRDCSWREISLDKGASLLEYLRGKENPATLAGANETLRAYQ